jgi:hypothetical protein
LIEKLIVAAFPSAAGIEGDGFNNQRKQAALLIRSSLSVKIDEFFDDAVFIVHITNTCLLSLASCRKVRMCSQACECHLI